jgi:hypothetical protein
MLFTILNSLRPRFEAKFSTWRKKFDKYGHGNFTYDISEPYFEDSKDSEFYKHEVVKIEVDGSYKILDWEFVASLEFVPSEGKNIVRKLDSSVTVPKEYITSTTCDHCHTNHLRIHTVVIKNTKTGEYRQVGKSCLKDYIGQDISDYARYLSFFKTLEDYIDSSNRDFLPKDKPAFDTDEVILQTIAEVDKNGYVSQAQYYRSLDEYGETSLVKTSTKIYHIMNESRNYYGEIEFPKYAITREIEDKYSDIIKFVYNQDLEEDDYLSNIRILLNQKYTDNKNLGLVSSVVGYYIRETKKLEAKNSNTPKSNYVGAVGDKINITAIPECIASYDTDFGVTRVYRFNVDNNVLIWKTGNCLDTDKVLNIKGTIKEHTEFRGIKQTVLTRCRVL